MIIGFDPGVNGAFWCIKRSGEYRYKAWDKNDTLVRDFLVDTCVNWNTDYDIVMYSEETTGYVAKRWLHIVCNHCHKKIVTCPHCYREIKKSAGDPGSRIAPLAKTWGVGRGIFITIAGLADRFPELQNVKLEFIPVAAKTWQKEIGFNIEKKKMTYSERKRELQRMAKEIYPEMGKKMTQKLCDASLIAYRGICIHGYERYQWKTKYQNVEKG